MEARLDEETRKKLFGISVFSSKSTTEFTPAAYLEEDEDGEYLIPEEARPVFTLRALNALEKKAVQQEWSKGKSDPQKVMTLIRKTILGVEKLYDAGSGEEIPFEESEEGGMSPGQFLELPQLVSADIMAYVLHISGLLPDYEGTKIKAKADKTK